MGDRCKISVRLFENGVGVCKDGCMFERLKPFVSSRNNCDIGV